MAYDNKLELMQKLHAAISKLVEEDEHLRLFEINSFDEAGEPFRVAVVVGYDSTVPRML